MGNVAMSPYGQYGDNKSGLAPAVVLLSVEASSAFFVISMAFYCMAHWLDWLPRVYSCRSFLTPQHTVRETPKGQRHPFSWLTSSWPISDRQVLRTYGLDALLFIRSLRVQSYIIFLSMTYCLCAVLPVNMSGHAARQANLPWGSRYTTMNLGPTTSADSPDQQTRHSRLFLVHILGAYLIAGVTLYMLWRQYKDYVELRHQYLSLPQPQQYTIMVDHIPSAMRSNYAVSTFFEHLFPGSIKKVTIMLEMEDLDAAIAQRDKVARELGWGRVVQRDHTKLRCHCCRRPEAIKARVAVLSKQLPVLEAEARALQEEFMSWHCRHERISKQASHVARLDSGTMDLSQQILNDGTIMYYEGGSSIGRRVKRMAQRLPFKALHHERLREEEEGEEDDDAVGSVASMQRPLLQQRGDEEEEEGYGEDEDDEEVLLAPGSINGAGDGASSVMSSTNSRLTNRSALNNNQHQQQDLRPSSLLRFEPSSSTTVNHLHKARRGSGKPPSAIRKLRDKTRDTIRLITGNPVGSTAFVSFKSLAVASICGRCMTYSHPLKMIVSPAPQPEDILWENVAMPMRQRPIRTVLGTGCAVVITIFFTVPVGIIAGFTNVETLRQHVPFVRHFLDSSALAREMLPYLPPFILVLVDNLIPPILSVCARVIFREVRLVSQAHMLVFERLYAFLLYNNFLILFLSSSLNTYFAILENPHDALESLGNFLPNISSFYVAYILIKALAGLPMEITRFSSYIVAVFRWMLTDDLTEAQKADSVLGCNHLHRPGGFYFGRIYADNLFVFTLTMTFALVAPLILPVSFLFFFGALVVYKRQLLFVYEPEFESGGAFWPRVYIRMVAALYFMQASLLCILITNSAFKEVAYIVPLPIITHFVSYVITRSYRDASQQLPLSKAMEIDRVTKLDDETYDFLTSCYIQPSLRPWSRDESLLLPVDEEEEEEEEGGDGGGAVAGLVEEGRDRQEGGDGGDEVEVEALPVAEGEEGKGEEDLLAIGREEGGAEKTEGQTGTSPPPPASSSPAAAAAAASEV